MCRLIFEPTICSFPCVLELKLCGVFWSEQEFVEQAMKAKHPLSLDSAVPQQLLDALHFTIENDEATVARVRAEFFSHWTRRALQLESDEKNLKKNMQHDVANAVSGKRILLFEEMLKSTGYPDLGVVDELRCGSDLTGEVPVRE